MDSTYIDDDVQIQWDGEIPNVDNTYTILRNGEKIGDTDTQTFTDENVEKGESYTYEISTKEKVSEEVFNERLQAAEEYGIEITPEMKEELSYDYYSVNSYIQVPEENLDEHMQTLNSLSAINRYGIQYTTFIAEDMVQNLGDNLLIPYNYYLGGDGRGFDQFNNNYRTRTAIMADFTNNRIQADTFMPGINSNGIDIGETIEYNQDGTVHNRDTQSEYTMDFNPNGILEGTAVWDVNHSVGIPISILGISPPDINYEYTARLASNSSGHITGSHDRAPHHEIAVYVPQSGISELIYTFTNEGFFHLFPEPVSPDRDFSIRF